MLSLASFLTGQPGLTFGNCLKINSLDNSKDPFTVFWTSDMDKNEWITKFESDMSQTSKDIACGKLRKFTDIWMVDKFVTRLPPPHKRLYNFATLRSCIFVSFEQITFKLGNLFI